MQAEWRCAWHAETQSMHPKVPAAGRQRAVCRRFLGSQPRREAPLLPTQALALVSGPRFLCPEPPGAGLRSLSAFNCWLIAPSFLSFNGHLHCVYNHCQAPGPQSPHPPQFLTLPAPPAQLDPTLQSRATHHQCVGPAPRPRPRVAASGPSWLQLLWVRLRKPTLRRD